MKCSPLIIAMIICASVVVNSYDLNETVLCATTSMPDIAHCNDTFIQEIKDSQNQIRDYCCACNDLKDCIVEHVGDKCGDTEIRQLADHYVKTAIRIGYPWGYCDAYRGFGGIVLCQQGIGHLRIH
ncbi:unnamed protein product [Oppiella nova]|uniref:Uncharacterized protein n=1 Tax=Oppiella nova TaxID=334625 RepID=A0A7R9LSL0_9ACAR|nr:unnamed protein product [Oppiella nova]CAG2166591.1 unnamed protein product [Oppiella nova]